MKKITKTEQYLKYLVVDDNKHINDLFKRKSYKMYREKIENESMKDYDEFDLD